MKNNGVVRIPGEAVPRPEEGNDVVGGKSGSISKSNSDTISNSDAVGHPDSDSGGDSPAYDVPGVDLDPFANDRLVRVREIDDHAVNAVKIGFLRVMSGLGLQTSVEAVYRSLCTDFTWKAKFRSFLEISRNMGKVGEGFGKAKHTWFGGSKDEIDNIFRYGFSSGGRGICLSPFRCPIPSLRSCVADENGLYHLILCAAVLGRSEVVPPGAQQRFPSSAEFHSGVDNLSSPHRYLVWSSYMNTHVMPICVVSFRPPVKANEGASSLGPPAPVNPVRAIEEAANAASSSEPLPMNSFPRLVLELELVLPKNIIESLQKSYRNYRQGKITKNGLTQKLRELVADDVLLRAVDSIRRKHGVSEEAAPEDSNNVASALRKSSSRSSANKVLKKLRGARSP